MPTQTATETRSVHQTDHELQDMEADRRRPEVSRAVPPAESPSVEHTAPLFKLLVAGFSFFCAGVDSGSLGPLIPYIIKSFTIDTGEIAIIYAAIFSGWLLAAVTNPFLAAYLSLGKLLAVGAVFQLLAQCLRPWAPQPLFFATFFLQALGMAYQDTHANTFASGVKGAHRWLGFIHAMFALGCLVGPLIATAIASTPGASVEGWRQVYYMLIGVAGLNVIGVAAAFRDTVWSREATVNDVQREQRRNKEALQEVGQLMKLKNLWLISAFYFFNSGAWSTAGGWVVEYLASYRHGDLKEMGYVPTGFWGGLFLGRLVLAEPTHRFGEQRMILGYSFICLTMQLLFWLLPNIIASATAFSLMGFFYGPFFATGMSVASRMFPRKVQSTALGFVFVLAQAGAAIFPSFTGLIAESAGVQVLQPVITGLIVGGGFCWWLIPTIPQRHE